MTITLKITPKTLDIKHFLCLRGKADLRVEVRESNSLDICGTWSVDYGAPNGNHLSVPNLTSQRQSPALMALGEALRRIRKAKSISQEGLALLAGVDRSYVGRVERGDNNVALLTLVRIAAALDVTVATLMEQAGL